MIQTLILHFDAPLQSWGIESRYKRRHAGDAPSKSAICGMVCAAMGAPRESPRETQVIQAFRQARMTAIGLYPAQNTTAQQNGGHLLADYHTVLDTRKASGGLLNHAVLTYRYYHQNKRFVVLLESEDIAFLETARQALINPVWGLWFGRKCCIPAAPVIRGPLISPPEARDLLHKTYEGASWEIFAEVDSFEAGSDTWNDQPVAFGHASSSGGGGRLYTPRRIKHGLPSMQPREALPSDEKTIRHIMSPEEEYFQF